MRISTNLPRFGRRLWLFVSLLFVLLPAVPASAHASLVSSTPKDGGKLPESGVIELSFNEDVSPMSRSFRLNNYAPDSSVSSVEVDVSNKSDSVLVVSPKTPLDPGTWSLLWQVESADGHPVAGVLRFSVGDVQLSLPPVPAVSDNSNVQDRALESSSWLIAPLLLASMLLSRSRLMYVSAGLLLFTTSLRLLGFYDKFSWSMFDSGEAKSTLALGIGSLVPFLDNLLKKTPTQNTNYFKKYAALLSLVLLFSSQGFFSGHHRLTGVLSSIAQPLHLAAALCWAAALCMILLSKEAIYKASRLATLAVYVLIPSVLLLAYEMLYKSSSLGRWEYTVFIKTSLTVAALFLGLFNHKTLRKNVIPKSIRKIVTIEILILVSVAFLSASIGSATPSVLHDSKNITTVEESTTDTTNLSPSEQTLPLVFDDGSKGRLVVSNLKPGSKASAMLFFDNTFESIEGLEWSLSNETAGLSGLSGSFMAMGDHFHGFFDLPAAGSYTIVISAVVDTFSTITTSTSFTVSEMEVSQ